MRVVIMGGTSGIGFAAAVRLAAEGAEVIVTGRDPQKLAAAKEAGLTAEQVDGTVEGEVAAFLERTGAIDHLVLAFSPGAVGLGPVREVAGADVRAAFDGKLFAYLDIIRRAEVTGSVTLVGAVSARVGMAGTVTLAAVNGAVERAVPALAAELAPVRVNAVSPGGIDTAWWSFLPPEQRRAQFATAADTVVLRRVGEADEVGHAIQYLIHAGYVTGAILPVDGGIRVA